MKRRLIAVAAVLAAAAAVTIPLVSTSGPHTYYVSASGNDSSAGTASAPWKTIAKANAAVQPGDTVVLNGSFVQQAIAPSHSGTSTAPITYEAGTSGASLDQPGLVGATPYEVYLGARSYVVIEGLSIGNSNYINAPVANKGVVLRSSSYITISNCQFSHMQMQLISSSHNTITGNVWRQFVSQYVNGQPQTSGDMLNLVRGSSSNEIAGNDMQYAGHSLIEVGNGAGNTVETANASNWIHGNTLSNPWYKDLILSDNGAGTIVENNRLLDANSKPTLYSTVPGMVGQLQTSSMAVQFSGENFILRSNTIANAVATYGVITFGGRWYYGGGSTAGGTLVESLNNQVYGNTIQNSEGAAAISFEQNYTSSTDASIPNIAGNVIHDNAISGMTTSGSYSWDKSSHYETIIIRSFKGAPPWSGLNTSSRPAGMLPNQAYTNSGFSQTNALRYSYVNAAGATTPQVMTLAQLQTLDSNVYGNS